MRAETKVNQTEILLKQELFVLLAKKAIFWPRHSMLIVSDIHLGKAGHFRKNGLAVPGNIHATDLEVLGDLIYQCRAHQVVFLGDLFHSEANSEWPMFCDWIQSFPNVKFILVEGNHDILPKQEYHDAGLELIEILRKGQFSFSHEKVIDPDYYNFSGHIHPGIKLRGKAKQGLRVPCFFFSENHAYMPAFGAFTGLHPLRMSARDKVFAIAGDQIMSLNR